MKKIEIALTDGKWLINGKTYKELTYQERQFFDEFIIASKMMIESEKNK